jgi:PAS domain S-box-containing protein
LDVHRVELEMQNAELCRARDVAETALEMYTDLFDFAPVGYLTLDRAGIIRGVNLTGASLLGIARSWLPGRSFRQFIAADARPAFALFCEKVFSGPGREACETKLQKAGSSPLTVQIVGVAAASGAECRIALIDLTARREAEEALQREKEGALALRRAKETAETINRTKSLFLANMSHELRTPMTGVLGMIEIALEGNLDPQQRDCIETAGRSARSLLQILNDILDMTMIEEGKLSIDEREFPPAACVKLAVEILIPEARRKGIELILSMADDLPEIVVGDKLRLQQILTNLIGNAVKFTEKGKVEVTVAAGDRTAAGRRELTFTVADTGIGIPPDSQGILFRPFSQADASHTRRFGGTGLGLAISREIVERMGGTIGFDSEEGQGSRFSFTLPLCEAGCVCGELPVSVSPVAKTVPHPAGSARPRLLIAEDDAITTKVFGMMLKNLEFDFDFVADGRRVVEMWEKGGYDLIIMDVQMPVLDGFKATAIIRERERESGGHVPILAMTAHALREDEEKCLAAGMDAYVSKPIDFMKCIEVIREMLAKQADRLKTPAM